MRTAYTNSLYKNITNMWESVDVKIKDKSDFEG